MRVGLGLLALGVAAAIAPAPAAATNLGLWTPPFAERVLYAFDPRDKTDGANPAAPLVMDRYGALYGTTEFGGVYRCNGETCGTVFKLTPTGAGYTESVIHIFQGGPDGAYPVGGLLLDKNGDLYGTTPQGGSGCQGAGCGTVFELTPSRQAPVYRKTTIYNFSAGRDGASPQTALIADARGDLFGTTTYGGSSGDGFGTVFKLTKVKAGYRESIIHRFLHVPTDGQIPNGSLLMDKHGTLFGVTIDGGSYQYCECGAVYALTPTRSGYMERLLYSFKGWPDGSGPYGSLVVDRRGTLYGVTTFGGAAESYPPCGVGPPDGGCGAVFQLMSLGSTYDENIVHSFRGPIDGAHPRAGLTIDANGMLYGTTYTGGTCIGGGCGTVFELARNGSQFDEAILHSFAGDHDGLWPSAALIIGSGGTLYGTSVDGGDGQNDGLVFEVTP